MGRRERRRRRRRAYGGVRGGVLIRRNRSRRIRPRRVSGGGIRKLRIWNAFGSISVLAVESNELTISSVPSEISKNIANSTSQNFDANNSVVLTEISKKTSIVYSTLQNFHSSNSFNRKEDNNGSNSFNRQEETNFHARNSSMKEEAALISVSDKYSMKEDISVISVSDKYGMKGDMTVKSSTYKYNIKEDLSVITASNSYAHDAIEVDTFKGVLSGLEDIEIHRRDRYLVESCSQESGTVRLANVHYGGKQSVHL